MAIVENIPPPGLGAALMPGVVGGSVVLGSAARQSNGIRKRMHHCLGWDAAAMLQMLQMLQLRSGPSDTTSARHLPIFCMLPPMPTHGFKSITNYAILVLPIDFYRDLPITQ